MDYQSLPSSSIENPLPPVRRRSSSRQRGRSLNSTHSHNVSRTSVRSTSSSKPTRGANRRSTQSSIIRSSSTPSSNPPDQLQIAVSPLPFDCPSDDEQQQQQQKQSMSVTTRSGKMKKDAILSYFILRSPGKYDCILCHKACRKELDKTILVCIIDVSLPFTTFTKSGMINLLQTFDSRYDPPNRFTIASRVGDAYHDYMEQSGARKYYILLTAHVFDDDFEVIPLVLSLRQLTGRHLAINVEAFIKYELNEKFQIMPNQQAGITTDCGSEMVSATAHGLFGPRHSCIAHVWNNVVKNGLCLWEKPNPKKFSILQFEINDQESIRNLNADEDDLLGDEVLHTVQSDEEEIEDNNEQNSSQLD
ncbi:unnamed protein product [Adineta steineri]|uniref:Uncharacterized protein n=1 Tax=Adineta steineri TaxID=433720 RepID=A0A814WJJ0_9BILA|nr:unnamed protein product [Adineta steineri]CAF4011285.1 unnamed protein product [Adineta steineri]